MRSKIIRNVSSIPGWRTRRKIVVIESDDWGSIGMPSTETYHVLRENEIIYDDEAAHYYKYDALESNDDLSGLFEVLASIRDGHGNHPAFTGFNVVANPDFDRITAGDFEEYHYEPLTSTLDRYPQHNRVLALWKEGYEKQLFVPQFHGREHLNVTAWMKALKEDRPKTRKAFDLQVFGIDPLVFGESLIQFRAAFDIGSMAEIRYLETVISEGADLFRELMGYSPAVFVPPNGPFNLALEHALVKKGIHYLILDKLQKEPLGDHKYRTRIRYIGKRNKHGQIYLSRNASFEPSSNNSDWVGSCLAEIKNAFFWNKPATISSHRVNYIGFLNEENRGKGLRELKRLLHAILKSWPDVEFMTTDQLGDLISKDNTHV